MTRPPTILAHQLKAARSLARLDQKELSTRAGVSVPTIKRMEAGDGPIRGTYENVSAVVNALENAGVEFTNGGQPGVRMKAMPHHPNDGTPKGWTIDPEEADRDPSLG
jgi:transcriptional regulator with XRE-family HTH domain